MVIKSCNKPGGKKNLKMPLLATLGPRGCRGVVRSKGVPWFRKVAFRNAPALMTGISLTRLCGNYHPHAEMDMAVIEVVYVKDVFNRLFPPHNFNLKIHLLPGEVAAG